MKKLRSLILALALCLSLTAPAFAASDLTGAQLHPSGEWGSGPSLTLKGVTGERAVEMELPYCYDVSVGGSLVLDMPYPAGKNRTYTIMTSGVYISSDYTAYPDNGQDWDVPAGCEGGFFDEHSGKSQYIYNFTEADMGRLDGYEKAIYMSIYWDESVDGSDYASDYGSVYFYIHVVPAESSAPSANIAYASTQTVDVGGRRVEFQMYALKDANGNDTNYIKLRDLAQALNGTQAQFEVGWNGAVNIENGKTYTANGSEMSTPFSGNRPYEMVTEPTNVNGAPVSLSAFILKDDNGGAYTYYQLRDLGRALGFNVDWSAERGIFVEPGKPYSGTN